VNWDPVKDAERVKSFQWHHLTHNFAFSHNLPAFDIKPRLHEVKAPVLITHGRHDWIIPLSAAEDMQRLYPHARLVVFENSGHSPQIEEADKWEAAVRRFLTDNHL